MMPVYHIIHPGTQHSTDTIVISFFFIQTSPYLPGVAPNKLPAIFSGLRKGPWFSNKPTFIVIRPDPKVTSPLIFFTSTEFN